MTDDKLQQLLLDVSIESPNLIVDEAISDEQLTKLCCQIKNSSALHSLEFLSPAKIGVSGAEIIASQLLHTNCLLRLRVSHQALGDEGTEILAKGLKHNRSLIELDLSSNNIRDTGILALSKALHNNQTLQCLKLSNNDLIGKLENIDGEEVYIDHHDQGIVAFFKVLGRSNTLTELYLSNIKFGLASIDAFAGALIENATLKTLDLSRNEFTRMEQKKMAGALSHNKGISFLAMESDELNEVVHVESAFQFKNNMQDKQRKQQEVEAPDPAQAEPSFSRSGSSHMLIQYKLSCSSSREFTRVAAPTRGSAASSSVADAAPLTPCCRGYGSHYRYE